MKELESGSRSSSMERVLKRNQELESEIDRLRTQLSSTQSTPSQAQAELSEDMYSQPKNELGWMPESNWAPSVTSAADIRSTVSSFADNQYPASSMAYDQDMYAPTAIPIWNDPQVFGQSQNLTKTAAPAWTPFHPAFSQPSRFADLQPAGFTELVNNPSSTTTTCWQSQPSIYAWQISTKLKAPVTHVDQLMFSVIQTQRHLAITSDLTGEDIVGPNFPSVHILFDQPWPAKPPSSLTEVMERYSAVLSNRGFALIPEKLASFMCMYRFVQVRLKMGRCVRTARRDGRRG